MFILHGSNMSKLRWKIHKCHSNHKTVEGFLSQCKPHNPVLTNKSPLSYFITTVPSFEEEILFPKFRLV